VFFFTNTAYVYADSQVMCRLLLTFVINWFEICKLMHKLVFKLKPTLMIMNSSSVQRVL